MLEQQKRRQEHGKGTRLVPTFGTAENNPFEIQPNLRSTRSNNMN